MWGQHWLYFAKLLGVVLAAVCHPCSKIRSCFRKTHIHTLERPRCQHVTSLVAWVSLLGLVPKGAAELAWCSDCSDLEDG